MILYLYNYPSIKLNSTALNQFYMFMKVLNTRKPNFNMMNIIVPDTKQAAIVSVN